MAPHTGIAGARRARCPVEVAGEHRAQIPRALAVLNCGPTRPASRRSARGRVRIVVASRALCTDRSDVAVRCGKGLKSSVMFHLGRDRWKRRDHRIGFAPDDGRRRELGRVRPSLSFALPVPPRLLACLAIISVSASYVGSCEARGEQPHAPECRNLAQHQQAGGSLIVVHDPQGVLFAGRSMTEAGRCDRMAAVSITSSARRASL